MHTILLSPGLPLIKLLLATLFKRQALTQIHALPIHTPYSARAHRPIHLCDADAPAAGEVVLLVAPVVVPADVRPAQLRHEGGG